MAETGVGIKAPLTAPAGPVPIRLARILQDSRSIDFGRRCDERRSFAPSDRPGEDRQGVPSRIPAPDGGSRARGAAGQPASRLFGRGHGAVQARSTSRPSAAAAVCSRCCGGRRRRCSIRTSRPAPRTRTARACSTSRWPAGTTTATCGRQLAESIPGREDGTLAADGKSVTWKLKKNVKWHDGQPFTADDVVFNWQYAARSGDGRRHQRRLYRHHGREGRLAHRHREVQGADAVLGRRVRRLGRHDHPQAPVRRLHRRQVARGADQPQAGRHRPVHVQGLQAGRHGDRRDQPELPRRQPPALRRHRDEGRRRRGVGGARRAADRRVRLRLEHAGRGRDPHAPGEGRQGPRRHQRRGLHRAHPAQQHRPVDRGRRRAFEPQDQASDAVAIRRCARRCRC